MTTSQRIQKLSRSAVISALLVLAVLSTFALAGDVFFFDAGLPYQRFGNEGPFPPVIYRLDTTNRELEPVWTLDKTRQMCAVVVYSSLGLVIASEGDWRADMYHVFFVNGRPQSDDSCFSLMNRAGKYNFLTYPKVRNLFQSRQMTRSATGRISVEPFDTPPISEYPQRGEVNADEYRFGGLGPRFGQLSSDVLTYLPASDGSPIHWDHGYGDLFPEVPPTVIQLSSLRHWNLIASEERYQALISVTDSRDITEAELLLFDRQEEAWHSMMIEGARTGLHIKGQWLVGNVYIPHPNHNFDRPDGIGPVMQPEIVFVDPLKRTQFTVNLGEYAEILWITDDSTIYYAKGVSLYQARIGNGGIGHIKHLIKDPAVRFLHWGFEMEDCEEWQE